MIEVIQLNDIALKEQIAEDILNGLPDWFGIPESTKEYIAECKNMVYFAAYDGDNPVGFLAVKHNNPYTAEIYVMGIKKEYHRKGVGNLLYHACVQTCKTEGYEFIQVKTLDSSHPDIFYAGTRKYYEVMGFRPLECFPSIWGKESPCLIMIQTLK